MVEYSSIFICDVGKVSLKYLGICVHHNRVCNASWDGPVGKVEKKLHTWDGKQNSYGGRLILLDLVLVMFLTRF
jgi:hypothetical protein